MLANKLFCPGGQRHLRQMSAEALGRVGRTAGADVDMSAAIRRRHAAPQVQQPIRHGGIGGNGHGATAPDPGQERPLSLHRLARRHVLNRREQGKHRHIVATLDAQGALGGGGKHDFERKNLTDHIGMSQALQPGLGKEHRVIRPIGGQRLAHPRIHIAAYIKDMEVGSCVQQLCGPATAAGADCGAKGQCFQRVAAAADQHIGSPGAQGHGAKHQTGGQLCGKVLQTVYGEVDGAAVQSTLKLGREDTLAAKQRKWSVQDPITLGVYHLHFPDKIRPGLVEQAGDVFGLPAGKSGAPRAQPQAAALRLRQSHHPAHCLYSARHH